MKNSIYETSLPEVVEVLQQEMDEEIVAVYGRFAPSEFLVILYDTDLTHLEGLRALYHRLKPLGSFQFMAYSDLLNQISAQSLQMVSLAYHLELLWGQDVLKDYVVNLSTLSEALERGLNHELAQFRQEFLDAPVPLATEGILLASWKRFENQLLPGLMLISGILTPPPPLWENLARAFSLSHEKLFSTLKALADAPVQAEPQAWQLCLDWEEALKTLTYQTYRFAGHLQEQEVTLSQIAGLGQLLNMSSPGTSPKEEEL